MSKTPKILIVDDKVENLVALEKVLSELDVEFLRATSGNEALKETLENDFAIVLIDVQMPGMDGYETVRFIRQENKTRYLPIIFVSAVYTQDYHKIKGIETGAVDFITKPIIPKILLGKVRVFLDLHANKILMEDEIRRRKRSEKALKESEVELKKINEQLEENYHNLEISEERFRSLVFTIPDIIYRIDKTGRFIFLNDAVQRLGYEPEELIGEHFGKIILPAETANVSRSTVLPEYTGRVTGDENAPKLFDERRTEKRKTTGLEVRLAVKGGKGLESSLLQPIGDDVIVVEVNSSGIWQINPEAEEKELIGTVGVIRDITKRKVLEKGLQKAYEELEIKVRERTAELSESNKALNAEISVRKQAEEELQKHREQLEERVRERTAELQIMVNAMAGREVRMAGLKKVIRELRAQLEEAGMKPVADDPIRET